MEQETIYYCGRPLNELTKEDLIEVVQHCYLREQQRNRERKEEREVYKLLLSNERRGGK